MPPLAASSTVRPGTATSSPVRLDLQNLPAADFACFQSLFPESLQPMMPDG
jgi:hypothetical protein